MMDRIDRQIARLIRQDPVSSGLAAPEDRDRPGRLWDRIYLDGLRAVRARRIRRTCFGAAAGMLALFVGSILVSFLWDMPGVHAFREGLTRDIRTHGDEISISYQDDHPLEPEAPFTPVMIQDGTIADVQALDIFFPIPVALPEGMEFSQADILYTNPAIAQVYLAYRDSQDTPLLVVFRYGGHDLSMNVGGDTVRIYEWDGVEVTHCIHDDHDMAVFLWHIGEYMVQVNGGIDLTQARAVFDDINFQLYEDWKRGDW